MKPSWDRISTTLIGDKTEAGKISVYFDYNLKSWGLGATFQIDPSWFDFHFEVGPFSITVTLWRTYEYNA